MKSKQEKSLFCMFSHIKNKKAKSLFCMFSPIKNKKGAEKIFSIYWFLILAIIAGAIVIGVMIFYSYSIDVREIEADVLSDKVINCIVSGGYLKSEVLKDDFDLAKFCNLDLTTNFDEPQYYIQIEFLDLEGNEVKKPIKVGRGDFVPICNEDKKFPVCVQKRIYAIDENSEEYLIKILAGVRKTEKNVR